MQMIDANTPMSPQDFHKVLNVSLRSALMGAANAGPENFDDAMEVILSSLALNTGVAIAASSAGNMAMVDDVVMYIEDLIRKSAMDATEAANERVNKAMGA